MMYPDNDWGKTRPLKYYRMAKALLTPENILPKYTVIPEKCQVVFVYIDFCYLDNMLL